MDMESVHSDDADSGRRAQLRSHPQAASAAARGVAAVGPASAGEAGGRESPVYPWGSEWWLGGRISLGLIAICILLISATPLLTHYDWSQTLSALLSELQPFPS